MKPIEHIKSLVDQFGDDADRAALQQIMTPKLPRCSIDLTDCYSYSHGNCIRNCCEYQENAMFDNSEKTSCELWWDGSGKCRVGFNRNCTTDPCWVSCVPPDKFDE